ncbi:MAG: hypothetical protein AAGA96_17675 [Verrucomicrobiota bacterium]
MKNTVLTLLSTILLIGVINLLANLGLFGGSGAGSTSTSYEYKSMSSQQMDSLGFREIAEEEGIPISEEGEINFPQEMVGKIAKINMLPRTIELIEKDGGWEFVDVTSDNFYIFRRAK